MSTETSEVLLVLIALVAAVVNYLQQQEQNRIFREQNRIFAESGGKTMPPDKPRLVWLKRYWPTLITVLVFLLIGYDIYDRRSNGSSPSSTSSIPWLYGLVLALISVGVGLMIGRMKRDALSENVDDVLASLPKQTPAPLPDEELKKRSKLVIHWANYRAVENVGEICQVGDFLQQIVSGNSLVFDIENHNFKIAGKDFVPHDPAPHKEKRLQVNFSYGSDPAYTTERREHGRLLLPEDSKIKWLMGEVERLRAAQPKALQYPIPVLRLKVLEMISALQGFLGAHGEEPKVERQLPESPEAFQQRWRAIVPPWQSKFRGDYRIEFGESVQRLRDAMLSKAAIDDWSLNGAIERAANDPNRSVEAVQQIAKRLWELGYEINV